MNIIVEEAFFTLSFNRQQNWIYIIWAGEPNLEAVKRGCMEMLNAVKETGCNRILSDARGVMQSWADAAEWTGTVWFPLMQQAGLKHLAFVQSTSSECQLALTLSLAYADNPPIALFDDIEQARKWLSSIPE